MPTTCELPFLETCTSSHHDTYDSRAELTGDADHREEIDDIAFEVNCSMIIVREGEVDIGKRNFLLD